MRQGSIVTVPSKGYALLVDQAKRQLRIEPEDTDEDVHIGELCGAAHNHVERMLGYPILRQTRETHLKCFPHSSEPIWLGGGDDFQVTAVRYRDASGADQTVAATDYRVNAVGKVCEIYAAPNFTWPATENTPSAVVIEWQAGWTNPADVPQDILQAMKLLIGHWDMNREAVIVGNISTEIEHALDAILDQFRTRFVA